MSRKRLWTIFLSVLILLSSLGPMPLTDVAFAASGNNNAPNGGVIVIHQPPKGWNPLTATDRELAFYAYPARPTDPQDLEEWKQVVSAEWVMPEFETKGRGTTIMPRQKTDPTSTVCGLNSFSQNWSGVVSLKTYTRVVGWWTVPWAYADAAHQPAYSTHWIGLGDSELVQMGTGSYVLSGGAGDYFVWWEIVGTSAYRSLTKLTTLPVQPGDKVYADIVFQPGTNSTGTASFYMTNQTTGKAVSFQVTNISNIGSLADASANWIAERPYINSTLPRLANFGTVTFKAKAGSSASVSYPVDSDLNTEYVTMQNSLKVPLAIPGQLNSTGDFSVTWKAYE